MGRGYRKCDRCNELKQSGKTIQVGNLDFCKHCYSYLRQIKVVEDAFLIG